MLLLSNISKAVSVELIKIISAIKTALWHDSLYCLGGLTCSCTYSSFMRGFVPLYNVVRDPFLKIEKQLQPCSCVPKPATIHLKNNRHCTWFGLEVHYDFLKNRLQLFLSLIKCLLRVFQYEAKPCDVFGQNGTKLERQWFYKKLLGLAGEKRLGWEKVMFCHCLDVIAWMSLLRFIKSIFCLTE